MNCPPGTYSGINYGASDPGITINIAAGVTVTSEGVGATGSGDITVNGDPSDTFTSTDPNQAALYGRTSDGNVTLIAGDVSAPPTTAILARTDSGDIKINVGNVTGGVAGQGIVVGGAGSGAPGNVSITTGDVSAPSVGIGIDGPTGLVTIHSGNVSSANAIGIIVTSDAGAPTDISITANSVSGPQNAVFINGATGNVSVAVAGAASSTTGAGIGIGASGAFAPTNVTVTAGSVSGAGVGVGVSGATGDVSIAVAGSASSANGTGIAVADTGGAPKDVSVTAGSVSGADAGIDITGATGNVSVAVSGAVSGAGAAGIDVQNDGADAPMNVTLATGSVSGNTDGIDVSGATGGVSVTVNGNVSASSPASVGIFVGNEGAGDRGNVTVTADNVSGGSAGVDVAGAKGNVSVTVGDASAPAGIGIFVANAFSPTSANIIINSGNASGVYGIGATNPNGCVSITSGTATATGDGTKANFAVLGIAAGIESDVTIVAGTSVLTGGGFVADHSAGTFAGATAIDGESANGSVTIKSGSASISAAGASEAIYAQALAGNVTITSGDASAQGPGTGGIYANAGYNVTITSSGNITTTGGLFSNPGGVTGGAAPASYPAGNYASDGIFAISNPVPGHTTGGNITIIANNISTTGTHADGIVANAVGTNTITVTGNISSAQGRGIALASGGASTVTVQAGASVSGVIGIDASGMDTGFAVGNNTAGVQGGLSVIDDGTITGTGGTAIRFLPGPSILSGDGLIVGDVVMQPGNFLAPGDLVTLSIRGNLLFSTGSTYVAEVAAGSPGRSGAPGDLVAVTGAVTINPGVNFIAMPLGSASSYANNTQYVVLSATGGVSGNFSTVTSTAPLLSASLMYPHDEVVLVLRRNDKSFASQAVTPNQAAAAAAIEAGGSDSALYTALVGQTALGLQTGYSELDGESYADIGSMMLEQSDDTRRSLVNRMNAPNATEGLWVATYGDTSTADDGANFQHARTALGGSASGVDFTIAGWRAGLATSVGYDALSLTSRGASTVDSNWTVSAYAAYDSGGFDARFGATYGWHRLASSREVAVPGYADASRSLTHVTSGEAFGEVGWTWKTERGWVEPFAGVALDRIGGFALAEAGGASALNVTTQERTLLTERVGVQGQTSLFGLTLHGEVAWRHASGDLSGVARATFQSTGESFTVHGLPIAANAAEITAGLSGKLDKRTTLDLSYHGEAGDHFSDNAMRLKAAWRF